MRFQQLKFSTLLFVLLTTLASSSTLNPSLHVSASCDGGILITLNRALWLQVATRSISPATHPHHNISATHSHHNISRHPPASQYLRHPPASPLGVTHDIRPVACSCDLVAAFFPPATERYRSACSRQEALIAHSRQISSFSAKQLHSVSFRWLHRHANLLGNL
jgi:hypothetical protein